MMKQFFFLLPFSILLFSCSSQKEKEISNVDIFKNKKLIDLTHSFSRESVYWVTAKEFELEVVAKGETDNGYFYAANNFETAEHGGTHIDAPIHFAKGKQTVDEIPLENLVGKAIKVDVSKKAMHNIDYLITVQDFLDWEESEKTQIPEGSIVLLETGHSKNYPDKKKYLGTDKRGEDAVKDLHFPGLSPEAAKWLIENRSIKSIGLDTPSIDFGQSKLFKTHVLLLSENIPAFENLTNLEKLPNKNFDIMALPMKIEGGSGGPLRIVAVVNID